MHVNQAYIPYLLPSDKLAWQSVCFLLAKPFSRNQQQFAQWRDLCKEETQLNIIRIISFLEKNIRYFLDIYVTICKRQVHTLSCNVCIFFVNTLRKKYITIKKECKCYLRSWYDSKSTLFGVVECLCCHQRLRLLVTKNYFITEV